MGKPEALPSDISVQWGHTDVQLQVLLAVETL